MTFLFHSLEISILFNFVIIIIINHHQSTSKSANLSPLSGNWTNHLSTEDELGSRLTAATTQEDFHFEDMNRALA